jgi:hypothetical protein
MGLLGIGDTLEVVDYIAVQSIQNVGGYGNPDTLLVN